MNRALMNDITVDFSRFTKEMAIAAWVQVARDPSATAKERKNAHNWILLLNGAIDGFKDVDGEEVVAPRAFIELHPDSPDAPEVRALIETRYALETAHRLTRK